MYGLTQAQPQSQLSWADLALLLSSPAARPSGQAVKEQESAQLAL